ncbi:retention module-containing protein, partial [Marinobacterium sp. MBR-109]|uniref:retention module-containing protein n=1 Tax=Marinobacterium sp. MBR-109 TaxID=3156462 RepID=UPI0033927B80
MSTSIGSVSFIQGQVVAVAADGTERVLALGDQVMSDEVVRTSPDARIEISMDGGELVSIGNGDSWVADAASLPAAEGAVGTVSMVSGQVVAMAADGTERVLMAGDVILADEVIRTGPDARVEIAMQTGEPVTLQGGQSWLVSLDTYTPVDQFDVDSATADVTALQQAILAGQDPTEILEPTAAGAPAAGAPGAGNEGADFVTLQRTGAETTPEAGYDTIGLSSTVLTPEGEEPVLLADEPEVPPVVTVEVEVEVETPTNPDDPNVPEVPNEAYPILVSGNSVSILEGSDVENLKQVTFNLVLDKVYDQDVTITYQLNGGTAVHGEDWLDGPSPDHTYTVTIPAGETSFPVTVYIVQDKLDEADTENLGIQLLSAENATINPDASSGTITIFDDDTTPVARDDVNSVTEDDFSGQQELVSVSGNVIGGAGASAGDVADTDEDGDTPVVTVFSNGTDTVAAGAVLVGSYGTLTIAADGSYTYELTDNSSDAVQGLDEGETLSDQFTYTITDGYNEPQTATLSITIKGEADGPQVDVVAANSFTEGEAAVGDVAFTYTGSDPDTAFADLEFTLTNNPYLQIGTPATESDAG